MPKSPLTKLTYQKFAWSVLGFMVLVILWGAFVRATHSGAGCGSHWPLCNGTVIPFEPRIETVIEFIKADAWTHLEQARDRGDRYDVIILDPPKLAKSRGQIDAALRGYHGLNTLALQILEPGGLLATCSCSGLVTRIDFEGALAEAALSANRSLRIIESRGAAPDHPISVHCPESEYLKCALCLA